MRFLGQGVKKRQFLDTLSKRKKILTDNWKALFLVFLCFLLFLSWFFFFLFFLLFFCFVFFCFFFCFVFFGGFKGQVRWPKGPPHLALNPPYFFVFVFLLFFLFLLEGLRVRWGGPKGTSLGPKPSLFSFCFFWFLFFFFALLSLFLIDKKPVFPLEKGIFC